ncbi:MAG TPA: hypothetical protein VES40_16605 [Ilumatobacteraceae bacterium]|nr:hypothetical protein [Ilumatobacteraceae bacterium]
MTFGPEDDSDAMVTVISMDASGRALSDAELAALCEALDDEFKAIATYNQVIADFGAVRPFVNIVEAERRHANALLSLFKRYEVAVPRNPWADEAPRFSTLDEACLAGVDGEIENAAMYSRLIAATSHPDIIEVFENLQRASQENHLEAFRRCANRQDGPDLDADGGGGGRRRRRHRGGSGHRS